ncbi:MAG: sigma factor [Anaerolineaceae bacterium]|nr:sigma factor [Anaerolineaceae bacterium]
MAEIIHMQALFATLEEPSDDTLVKAALRDTAQFASLYRRYAARIYRYCYSRTGCQARAEDLTSLIFLDALNNLPHYHAGTHFAAWLFAIAYRRVVDTYRRLAPDAGGVGWICRPRAGVGSRARFAGLCTGDRYRSGQR